jgi:hypothetical protein
MLIHKSQYSKSSRNDSHNALKSRKCYVRAIKALKIAIQDFNEAGTDETLYAVLLLCGYEVCLCSQPSPSITTFQILIYLKDYCVRLGSQIGLGISCPWRCGNSSCSREGAAHDTIAI